MSIPSSFWKLSAELRNTIYDLASSTPGEVFVEIAPTPSQQYKWQLKPRTCHRHPLAPTAVSRKMREETLGALLAVNAVSLIVPMLDFRQHTYHPPPEFFAHEIKQWLRARHPKERAALKTFELDLGTWPPEHKRGMVTEARLADILLDLATAMDEDGVEAVVWLTLDRLVWYPSGKPIPICFRLSNSDVSGVRAAVKTIEGRKQRMVDDYSAGRLPQNESILTCRHADNCFMRLQKLAYALERRVVKRAALRKRRATRRMAAC